MGLDGRFGDGLVSKKKNSAAASGPLVLGSLNLLSSFVCENHRFAGRPSEVGTAVEENVRCALDSEKPRQC